MQPWRTTEESLSIWSVWYFPMPCCCWLIIGQIDIRNTFLFEPKAWCCVHHPVRVKQAMQLDQLLWYTCRDKCAGLRNIFCFFISVNGRLRHLSIWVLLSICEAYCFSFKVNWCIDLMTSFEYTIKVSSSFTLESRRSVLHNVTQYFAPIVRCNLTQAFIMNQQTLCGFSQHALERFIFYKCLVSFQIYFTLLLHNREERIETIFFPI